jgi:hypothetical protein
MLTKIELDDLLEKPVEGSEMLSLMREELAAMKGNFDTCHELMKKLVVYDPPKEASRIAPADGSLNTTPKRTRLKFPFSRTRPKKSTRANTVPSESITSGPSNAPTKCGTPTIISVQVITETLAQGGAEEAELRDSTPFWRRLYWQALERKSFENAIEALDKSNKLLWRMIKLKSLSEPSFPLRSTTFDEVAAGELARTRSQLHSLHTLICHVNSARPRIALDIQLVQRPSQTKIKYVERFEELKEKICADTDLFVLHARLPCIDSSKSIRILAEFPKARHTGPEAQKSQDDEISSLSTKMVPTESSSGTTFKLLGRVSGPSTADWIRIYQDTNGVFSHTETLASLLREGSYRDRKFTTERTRMAAVVALSYLQCVDWHKWPDTYPRPLNYRIYTTEGTQTPPLKKLMPFFSWSLGDQKVSSSEIDNAEGPANAPVLELGIVLFQIGTWKDLVYDEEADIEEIAKSVKNAIGDVAHQAGVKYATIVEACLDTKGDSLRGYQTLYQRVYGSLLKLEEELRN